MSNYDPALPIDFYPGAKNPGWGEPTDGTCGVKRYAEVCPNLATVRMWVGCEHEHLSQGVARCPGCVEEIRVLLAEHPTRCVGCGHECRVGILRTEQVR